jgi:hypothetical protein
VEAQYNLGGGKAEIDVAAYAAQVRALAAGVYDDFCAVGSIGHHKSTSGPKTLSFALKNYCTQSVFCVLRL